MDAYIYQTDLYCEDCADAIKADIRAENPDIDIDENDEASFDSDDWPKGPYADGGGESDCPQHCGNCSTFLENDLTDDGSSYVMESIAEFLATGRGSRETVETWAEFYSVSLKDLFDRWM